MNSQIRFIALALSLAAAIGCGVPQTPVSKDGTQSLADFIQLGGGSLTWKSDGIEGSGEVIYKNPLGDLSSARNVAVQFTVTDGGSLSLIAYAGNQLKGGVRVRLSRQANQLYATFQTDSAAGTQHALAGIDASQTMSLQIDVHNNESPAHVLIWSGALSGDRLSDEQALLNSEEAPAPGRGQGQFLGFELQNAKLIQVGTGTQKFFEE